ncbi:uncharacterized protein LOC116735414 [Xiphophorus hellerii]|uniref:uncharacterized protein LOC116735414 n=1 Tax=Xiphophorus hellerii TaxID=8084 RepID=UPI0013B368D1|nr:uncharacterized protein LOC116735414 [Xiphophorus hellerii]
MKNCGELTVASASGRDRNGFPERCRSGCRVQERDRRLSVLYAAPSFTSRPFRPPSCFMQPERTEELILAGEQQHPEDQGLDIAHIETAALRLNRTGGFVLLETRTVVSVKFNKTQLNKSPSNPVNTTGGEISTRGSLRFSTGSISAQPAIGVREQMVFLLLLAEEEGADGRSRLQGTAEVLPGCRGSARQQRFCLAAEVLPDCRGSARQQRFCQTAEVLPDSRGSARLQRFCRTAEVLPGCRGSAGLQRFCRTAEVLPGCRGSAWLQRFCRAAEVLPGCRGSAGLQRFCWAAEVLLGCRGSAGLQRFCQTAEVLPDSRGSAGLQRFCLAAEVLLGCRGSAGLQRFCLAAEVLLGCRGSAGLQRFCQTAEVLPDSRGSAGLQRHPLFHWFGCKPSWVVKIPGFYFSFSPAKEKKIT